MITINDVLSYFQTSPEGKRIEQRISATAVKQRAELVQALAEKRAERERVLTSLASDMAEKGAEFDEAIRVYRRCDIAVTEAYSNLQGESHRFDREIAYLERDLTASADPALDRIISAARHLQDDLRRNAYDSAQTVGIAREWLSALQALINDAQSLKLEPEVDNRQIGALEKRLRQPEPPTMFERGIQALAS